MDSGLYDEFSVVGESTLSEGTGLSWPYLPSYPWHDGFMPQKKNNKKKESDEEALRNVEREMAKPRLAKSVRVAADAYAAEENPNEKIAKSRTS
jgi:hypothetical protein